MYTYREIKEILQGIPDEQLDQTATVYIEGHHAEYYGLNDHEFTKEDDVLDRNHLLFYVKL